MTSTGLAGREAPASGAASPPPDAPDRLVPARHPAGRNALRALLVALGAGLLFGLPFVNTTLAYDLTESAIYVVIALSLNVLVGYTGQLSLGQQGFVGLGAMTAANVVASGSAPADPLHFLFGALVAVGVGVGAAIVLGLVALRITGLYLALTTLVFGTAVTSSVLGRPSLNGFDAGVAATRPAFVQTPLRYYFLCLVVAAAVVVLDRRLVASKAGRAMLALRDNERAAQSFGIDLVGYKLLAFAVSGGLAGLGGALIVFLPESFSQKDYTSTTGFNLALTFVVIVVVGGLGNRAGVVLAALLLGLLGPGLQELFDLAGAGGYYANHKDFLPGLVSALLLLQTIVLNPGGLGGALAPVLSFLTGRRVPAAAPAEVSADARA